MALKKLDINFTEFKTEKHTYIRKEDLSFDEYRAFEKYEFLTGTGLTFERFFSDITLAIDFLNKLKFVQAATILSNLASAVKDKMENKWNPALILCTLFLVREDHVAKRDWNEAIGNEYIEDWKTEFEVTGFFSLAVSLVKGWLEAYEETSLNTLEKMKKLTTLKQSVGGIESGTDFGIKSQSE